MKANITPKMAKIPASALIIIALFCALPARACGPDSLGTERVVTISREQGTTIGIKTYSKKLALHDKELVLTFDDGPNPPTTQKVLDALKAECVKATFFLIGRNASKAPAFVRRTLNEGHSIGHHSYSHPAVTLRNLPESAAKADIDQGMADDDKAAYGSWNGQPKTPFFRYPGFGDKPALNAWLMQRGITIFGTDIWASDWLNMTPQAEMSLLLERIEKARKGVVLLHDTRPATAGMMPAFLRALKQRGYKIVHIVAGDSPTPLEAAPPGWHSETERILAHMWPKVLPQKTPVSKPLSEQDKTTAPGEDAQ